MRHLYRRRRRAHVNHERWLVSYADFITLLFAFFVVLYLRKKVDATSERKLIHTVRGVGYTLELPDKQMRRAATA
jgi:flagellar motor protein MotB